MKSVSVLLVSCLAAVVSADIRSRAFLLDGKCGSDDECQTRCHDKNEYLKPGVVFPDDLPKVDLFAQYLTGTCNWDGTNQCGCNPSDDTACQNIYPNCKHDWKGCQPKARQSTDPQNYLCDCPLVCSESDGHPDFPH